MQVSLSEIETSICKAVSAVNLPLGFGEDAGRAARCIAESGIGSLAAFVDALDALDNGQSTGFDTESAVMGEFIPKSAGQYLSALHAGPSACDLLVSAASTEPEFRKITLNDVDIPLVILFVSLVASTDMNMGLHLTWSKENNIEFDDSISEEVIGFGEVLPKGEYVLVNDILNKEEEELSAKCGDKVNAFDDEPPIDTVLGVEIFPVVHVQTQEKIYVSLEDIKDAN